VKQYLLAVQVDESAPPEPDAQVRAQMALTGAVTEEMKAAGSWVFVGGLQHSHASTVVSVEGGTTTMTDGPFAETKDLIAE
jgi:hypothetical protein